MRAGLLWLALFVASVGAPASLRAADGVVPFTLERTAVHRVAARDGGRYRVLVSWPDSPPPAAGYPVLYVLDGDDNFATVTETARRLARYAERSGVGPGLVVGIGYDGPNRRSLDYTPVVMTRPRVPGMPVEPTGGAAAFRAFLTAELRPFIERTYRVDRARQTLMGHSYGGLFVVDTLLQHPDLFQTYVAVSPSIWFADRHIRNGEADFARRLRAAGGRPTLLITMGSEERAARPAAAAPLVSDAEALANRLSAHGLAADYRLLGGVNHGTSLLSSMGDALLLAFPAAVTKDKKDKP